MAHLPADHCGPGAPLGPGLGPLTATFPGTRGKTQGMLHQFSKSNKAWQRCGVEERWKGWQLLLRRLPAAAKSLSSHLSHTFFPGGGPQSKQPLKRSGRVERAKCGNKKLETS